MVAQACDAIRVRLGDNSTGAAPTLDLVAVLKERGSGSLQEYAEWAPHGAAKGAVQMLYKGAAQPIGGAKLPDRIQFAFGAQFVEVRVHSRTREIRVPRIVGAFAAGES